MQSSKKIKSGQIITDFEDWTSFASSSTITGWTTPTITFLQYTRSGKVLTIRGRITGTSNSTSTSFTIPFTLANLGTGQGDFSLLYTNNSISSATAGVCAAGLPIGTGGCRRRCR